MKIHRKKISRLIGKLVKVIALESKSDGLQDAKGDRKEAEGTWRTEQNARSAAKNGGGNDICASLEVEKTYLSLSWDVKSSSNWGWRNSARRHCSSYAIKRSENLTGKGGREDWI